VTYLGVELDKTLTWKCQIEKAWAKAKLARAQLYPVIGRDAKTSVKTKLTLIRTIIQPHLTYASAAWGYAAKTHLKRLQAVENIALRSEKIKVSGSSHDQSSQDEEDHPPTNDFPPGWREFILKTWV